MNTVIESLGVYLPEPSLSTTEILEACKVPIRFPLEKVSGIKSRRTAGKHEFSIDLAKKAIADCLEKSSYEPSDIDLLICCNISRYDAPDLVSFEPCTAIKLKKYFGFTHALAFDITNACAGMFTGIYLVNTLLKTGAIRRGLVVSGEYITHLTQTAQNEIQSFMDPRLACLTLGDAGAAVILEKGRDTQSGFQEISLQTFGHYSPYCMARVSEQGGWIMHTDSVNLTDVAIKSGATQALDILEQARWLPDQFQHLILHQTSRMTLNSAKNEFNELLKSPVLHDGNTINNLEERGNTSSNSHFIALADQMLNNRIQSGDKVIFGISASGLTIGTALYVLDDLPDRLRQTPTSHDARIEKSAPSLRQPEKRHFTRGIRIESVGLAPEGANPTKDSLELLQHAATECLKKSAYSSNDIGLLIYSGVYRSEYLLEPAYAALLAGKLNMNATVSEPGNPKTFAFDIFNGAMGFLNACYLARQILESGKCKAVMIVASEFENNAVLFPDQLMNVRETASAIILDAHPEKNKGFSRMLFHYDLEAIHAYATSCSTAAIEPRLLVEKEPDLEKKYLACILPAVQDLLQQEGLELHQIKVVFPPQISSDFINRLSNQLGIPLEKFVEVVGDGPDLFSSSLPYGLEQALTNGRAEPGDIGLMIAVGSGIQAGCAVYYF